MTYSFGDGFDLYAAAADADDGYWDGSSGTLPSLVAGRFSGQAISVSNSTGALFKNSGQNDAVHHIVCALRQTAVISGSTLGAYLQLLDGSTGQCAVVFRSDGAIVLSSGASGGTVLATYTGAFPVQNTWYAFEFEIIINNTTGRLRVRKNGNTSDDYDSGAVLNTRPTSTNNYANRLQIGCPGGGVLNHWIDDLFWRSDASSVAWMGDIRCYTRMPLSDSSVQFSRAPIGPVAQQNLAVSGTTLFSANNSYITVIVPSFSGTIGSVDITLGAAATGHLKAAFYNSALTSVLGTSNQITNPVNGTNTFTFSPALSVSKGTTYYFAMCSDTSISFSYFSTLVANQFVATTYANFPLANPGPGSSGNSKVFIIYITTTLNADCVNEAQQDTTTTYVYDSTVGHADFYGIASISSTPSTIHAVTTRGYMIKGDVGSRAAAVQLKSGSTTVASPTLALTTSGWQWAWRTDTTDPNTGSAWTAANVDSVTTGPVIIS